MRLEVVNGQFGFLGKPSERAVIEKAIKAMLNKIESLGCIEDDECGSLLEISYEYDMDAYSVSEIKETWKQVKKEL